jgi:hypothetical protein
MSQSQEGIWVYFANKGGHFSTFHFNQLKIKEINWNIIRVDFGQLKNFE